MATSPWIRRPTSVTDALAAMAECPDFTLCAGGTALMLRVNRDPAATPAGWIFLQQIAELYGCERSADGVWRIGSLVCIEQLAALHAVPMLAAAAGHVGSWQLRNGATIGGNLVTAWATSDLIPALYALDAEVEISSPHGIRQPRIDDFLVEAGRTSLRSGEIVTAILIKEHSGYHAYRRVAGRAAMSPLICALAVGAPDKSPATSARVVVGDGIHLARRAPEAERLLWSTDSGEAFGDALARAAQPVDDELATAAYRRHALRILAQRAFADITQRGS